MSELKIAIQKSGRLSDNSKRLLEECGLKFSNGAGVLKTKAVNFPVEILFLRDDDIPQYVEQQVADIGILGENMVYEKKKDVAILEKLGFAQCRLSLAIPREDEYDGPGYFNNRKVATSYPVLLSEYFAANGINAEIEEISGSVEIAPGIGLADAVCDIVSSGSTLMTNGLREVITILKSQAVIIGNNNLSAAKKKILNKLLFRIRAVKSARENKYILLNAPEPAIPEICKILPGMKSPTILPLAEKGWFSLHSVVREDEFWERINQLRNAGAEGILVIPIEKMIL
ncbi:MAG TPA: ATP phosphoribosyltransferase [Bacteroidales bacterium]|nr:ATP phosphoribosyltransferase [Bacteroidales bacterium]HPF04247.1 ATP phosphoribosyltransferase [Bacteroidales bacterium]HPJ59667.1 ATP phosphoribosyltransferase [Bacteroidales bacterium]HPR12517.1 ATP phosphoribosyltransferase [Bacteroidales bacterium]HRW84916.1 ATP phosphoribosyltransferase [Bacteroidales bacterium]